MRHRFLHAKLAIHSTFRKKQPKHSTLLQAESAEMFALQEQGPPGAAADESGVQSSV